MTTSWDDMMDEGLGWWMELDTPEQGGATEDAGVASHALLRVSVGEQSVARAHAVSLSQRFGLEREERVMLEAVLIEHVGISQVASGLSRLLSQGMSVEEVARLHQVRTLWTAQADAARGESRLGWGLAQSLVALFPWEADAEEVVALLSQLELTWEALRAQAEDAARWFGWGDVDVSRGFWLFLLRFCDLHREGADPMELALALEDARTAARLLAPRRARRRPDDRCSVEVALTRWLS